MWDWLGKDFSDRGLTGALLYGCRPDNSGGSIEGTGEAVGAAMFRLVVISRTRITGNQTGTGEMTCRTGDCRRGDQRWCKKKRWKKWQSPRITKKKCLAFARWEVQHLRAQHFFSTGNLRFKYFQINHPTLKHNHMKLCSRKVGIYDIIAHDCQILKDTFLLARWNYICFCYLAAFRITEEWLS